MAAPKVKLGVIDTKAAFRIEGGLFTGKAMDGCPLSGKLESADFTYVGNFILGRRHGTGRIVYSDGDEYQGCWMNGGMVGDGRFTVKQDGTEYASRDSSPRICLCAPACALLDHRCFRGFRYCVVSMHRHVRNVCRS